MFSYAGKKAVVTGAGRGIGRQIALDFARQGADVVLAARTREQIEAVAGEVGQSVLRSVKLVPHQLATIYLNHVLAAPRHQVDRTVIVGHWFVVDDFPRAHGVGQ